MFYYWNDEAAKATTARIIALFGGTAPTWEPRKPHARSNRCAICGAFLDFARISANHAFELLRGFARKVQAPRPHCSALPDENGVYS